MKIPSLLLSAAGLAMLCGCSTPTETIDLGPKLTTFSEEG